jgi:hypothetical protein
MLMRLSLEILIEFPSENVFKDFSETREDLQGFSD